MNELLRKWKILGTTPHLFFPGIYRNTSQFEGDIFNLHILRIANYSSICFPVRWLVRDKICLYYLIKYLFDNELECSPMLPLCVEIAKLVAHLHRFGYYIVAFLRIPYIMVGEADGILRAGLQFR